MELPNPLDNQDTIKSLQVYLKELTPNLWGKFFYYCIPVRRRTILNNMQFVFNNILSPAEIKKLAISFYSHLSLSVVENIKMSFMSTQKIRKQAEVIGYEHVLAAAKKNKGVLILTGHFGNWELAPIAGILNFTEFSNRFYFIRKAIRNQFFEKLLFRRYYRAGLRVIPEKNSLYTICDVLDKNNAVVFVMDQRVWVKRKESIAVEFFGEKVGTYRSLAIAAKYTETPVIPACSYRKKDGKHVLEFFPALEWYSSATKSNINEEELYINTRAYNHILEKMILAHPDQWLWMHKRWKK
jgi:KDO2-lipid IV(A) lauroyltransferase